MNPGFLSIIFAALACVAALVSAVRWARGREGAESLFRWSYHAMTGFLAFGSVLLMVAILLHDFRYDYVIGYSSRDLPLLYLISAFWGGQQGTFLLWALVGALMGYPLFRKTAWKPAWVMTFYLPTVAFMIGLMFDPQGNPFKLSPIVPPDGRGLNPLLQDPWMATHPPAVFVGYAAMTIPAILALVALFRKDEQGWLGPALRWSLMGFLTLGVGIVLGGFWAYKVLGWGGYWGWDPVENASLIPWITGIALVHGLLVQRATGSLRRTNLLLALATYVLVLYSTFLTRSGVLAKFSVHSFPPGTLYRELLAILLLAVFVSLFALARRRNEEGAGIPVKVSWPLILTVTLVLLGMSALFVFFGTSLPIFSSLVGQARSVPISFYNLVNLPIYIGLFALLGLAPFLGWLEGPATAWRRRFLIALAVGLAGGVVAVVLGAKGAAFLLLLVVSLVALAANVTRWIEVVKIRPMHVGAAVAHIGFALMFLGIVASGAWGVKEEVRLPLGQPVDAIGMILTYRGHVDGSEPKHQWRIGVLPPGKAEEEAFVTLYNTEQGDEETSTMRKPAILRELKRDLYLAPMGIESAQPGGKTLDLGKGQPVSLGEASLTFTGFDTGGMGGEHGMTVNAIVEIVRSGRKETVAVPMTMEGGRTSAPSVAAPLLPGVSLSLESMAVEQRMIRLRVDDGTPRTSETLVLEASTKPLIGLLWAGTILVGLGCVIAFARRYQEARLARVSQAAPFGVTLTPAPARSVSGTTPRPASVEGPR